ncbi:hypothetical protein F4804DRAFT_243927 [Jackrogersella minutella]|nr:hypothetical protein F4804DRAFT_243927 [Jackrogersella minutella]
MVARRALTSASCSHCRSAVLKLFAANPAASALSSLRIAPFQCRPRLITTAPTRFFSSRPIDSESSIATEASEEISNENDAHDGRSHDNAAEDSASTNIPWYLQVEPPRHVASIEPPPLPELPAGSPDIIGSLLKHASEDLGLDELSLLDLRELDRIPALGPNLFMLFGTARSERHLNVSARRLRGWLRAEHRIQARSDGLLGPNERKTKLRRKAKRAKLLGGDEDTDDGIKTGWICVNLGTINRGKEESAVFADDGRSAGFGVSQHGFTIVVQIMTASRRAEMGLEALWKQALGEPVDDPLELESEDTDNLHPLEKAILANSHPPTFIKNGHFNDASRQMPFEQKRSYSTQQVITHQAQGTDPLLAIQSPEDLQQALDVDTRQSYRVVELLRAHLDEASNQVPPMGDSSQPQDRQVIDSSFLRLSSHACKNLPLHQTWGLRLAILEKECESKEMGTFDRARDLVQEMNLHGIEATRKQYMQLLVCIYHSISTEQKSIIEEQNKLAQEVLWTMQQRGEPVLTDDTIVTILASAAHYRDLPIWQNYLLLVTRLRTTQVEAGLPCMDESLLIKLMEAHAGINWDSFWDVWNTPPRYLRPRSETMYTKLYELVAAEGSPEFCVTALRRTFWAMLTEDPVVMPRGSVYDAFMKCIDLADPNARRIATTTRWHILSRKTEFVKMVWDIGVINRTYQE